jgi:hypothetical protein
VQQILVLDEPSAAYFQGRIPADVRVDIDKPGEKFHFGKRLSGVVERYGLVRPVYVGCGLPLIKADELAAVATGLRTAKRAVVSNNFFSADLLGFVPGSVASGSFPDNVHPAALALEGGPGKPRPAAHHGQPVRHRHPG